MAHTKVNVPLTERIIGIIDALLDPGLVAYEWHAWASPYATSPMAFRAWYGDYCKDLMDRIVRTILHEREKR